MQFRRLTSADLDAYFANRLRALADSPTAFFTTLEEEKERGTEHFAATLAHTGDENLIFGAVATDGTVVGTVGIAREKRIRVQHKATIWGVFVDKEHRGKGVGGKLLDLAIAHARARMGVATIYLSVETSSPAAKFAYLSRGFKVWGTEPKALGLGGVLYDEDHMTLVL